MSNSADIRDIQVLGDLKAAFGRFGEELQQILPALQKQFEEIQEQLDDRQKHWQRQADTAQEEVYEARRSLSECESQSDDEDGNSPDCSVEEEQVADAERALAENEVNLETVKQWRHRVEGLIVDFQNDIYRLSNLAFSRSESAQAFLANKIEILNHYIGGSSFPVGTGGLQGQSGSDKIKKDKVSVTAKMRETIRNAHYTSNEVLGGGINQTFLLKTSDTDGIQIVFKPGAGEDTQEIVPGIKPGTQYRREKVASLIDELLGIGLVPPTEIITEDVFHKGKEGSAQLFKEGFDTPFDLIGKGIIPPDITDLTNRQRLDWQLLDEVLGNTDRHEDNWMVRRRADGTYDIALIDNGRCLSELGITGLKTKPASEQKLDSLNRSRLEKFLASENEWRPEINRLVDNSAIDFMIKRAQSLLTRDSYE